MYVRRTLIQATRGARHGAFANSILLPTTTSTHPTLLSIHRSFHLVTADDLVIQKPFRGYAPANVDKENRVHYRFARLGLKNIVERKTPSLPYFYERILEHCYLRDMQVSLDAYNHMSEHCESGVNQYVYNTTLIACAIRNEWGLVGKLLANRPNPEMGAPYAELISMCRPATLKTRWELAQELFSEFKKDTSDNINKVETYNQMIGVYSDASDGVKGTQLAQELFVEMKNSELAPNAGTYTMLIESLRFYDENQASLTRALELVQEMKGNSVAMTADTQTALLKVYVRYPQHHEAAFKLFEEHVDKFQPRSNALGLVMYTCLEAKDYKKVFRLYDYVKNKKMRVDANPARILLMAGRMKVEADSKMGKAMREEMYGTKVDEDAFMAALQKEHSRKKRED